MDSAQARARPEAWDALIGERLLQRGVILRRRYRRVASMHGGRAMERDEKDISRARTDDSLGAERAGADMSIDGAAANERRLFDDLIERDRYSADARLLRYRRSADRVLAYERGEHPPADDGIALERLVADGTKQAERETTDAMLARERHHADRRSDALRGRIDDDRAERLAQRRDTDEHLVAERKDADTSAAALDRSEDVLAMVAHDLRSPLTVIMANSSILAEGTAEDSTREAAEDINRAAIRMGRLLTDLLDVVRIEAETFQLAKERVDAGALLAEVRHIYGPLFAKRGLSLHIDFPATPVIVVVDHDRVVQMVSNLLGNAMKFTPSGGVVDLYVEHGTTDLELVVRDTGSGIHPDDMPHIFERFYKRDRDARRGLGLGLYICKNIAEAHGGHISVQSELGQGATFRVFLPSA
ncbi:MAG: HAMP domain-containing sensor histidine kinase [Gammaproteobacteria bacterium]